MLTLIGIYKIGKRRKEKDKASKVEAEKKRSDFFLVAGRVFIFPMILWTR